MPQTLNGLIAASPLQAELDLAFMNWLNAEEEARQRAIIQARAFHDGDQFVYLTERMKKVLGENAKFNLNLVRTVVEAVAEILLVNGWDHDDPAQSDFAETLWHANLMDEKMPDVHEGALRDGEYFVLVDWDSDHARPRLTPHQRYTDPQVSVGAETIALISPLNHGDGFGVKAFYPDDDDWNKPMSYAIKRWTEYTRGNLSGNEYDPIARPRQRMTVYYPDHIEKYCAVGGYGESGGGGVWQPIYDPTDVTDSGEPIWPLPWVDAQGQPLGIPVIHFKNQGLRCEAWDAIPVQSMINKFLIDLLMAGDATAFRVFVALGFVPTSDGKEPQYNDKGEMTNALAIEPGAIIGTAAKPTDASFNAIDAANLTPLVDVIERAIAWTAMVTGTPVSRFQLTGQVASVDTQKEGSTPLLAKARNRQMRFTNAWKDVMALARKLQNTFGTPKYDDAQPITPTWEPLEPRDTLAELTEKEKFWGIVANTVAQSGGEISAEMVLRDLGWTDEQIAASGIPQRVTQDVIPNVGQ